MKARFLFVNQWLAGLLVVGTTLAASAQISINVANYGAVGDAVQLYVSTTSNSVEVSSTNYFSQADVGKTIEIYGVGRPTFGVNSCGVTTNGNQDLIGIITNVVNSTNLFISVTPQDGAMNFLPQYTASGVLATVGTDNNLPFFKAIAAAADTSNATIYIPNGKYLLMPNSQAYGLSSIQIHRGGLHFLGESESGTILLGRGAWQSYSGYFGGSPFRGFLFEVVAPITNDLPLVFENMTWDGGVQQGNLPNPGISCNVVDGLGWDEQHSAYLTFDSSGGISGTATHQVMTNVAVLHWRGEMFKSIDQNTNGNIDIENCFFGDGCATALNIYPAWNVVNNVFSNMFQVFEYYQAYSTNSGYFCNNFVTNITGNGLAVNGGYWGCPSFIIASNTFFFSRWGGNCMQTGPGANVSMVGNQINCNQYETVFAIGVEGAQGNMCNSNILIARNNVFCNGTLSWFLTYGGCGINGVIGLFVLSNTVSASNVGDAIYAESYASKLKFANNNFNFPQYAQIIGCAGGGCFPLIETNNVIIPWSVFSSCAQTNSVSYSAGPFVHLDYVATGNVFVLNDLESNQIPVGACLYVDNTANRWNLYHGSTDNGAVVVYPSESMATAMPLPCGQGIKFFWNGSSWSTNLVSNLLAPPMNFHVLGR